MRPFPLLLFLPALVAVVPLVAQESASSHSPTAFAQMFADYLGAFQKMYPRVENSAGERQAIDYISSTLSGAGVQYEITGFQQMEGGHSFSKSIYATVGASKVGELLVVAPLDHPEDATADQDGSANLALALSLAVYLKSTSLPVTIRFLFLGAEYGSGPAYPIGTHRFLNSFFPDTQVVVMYLAFGDVPNRIFIRSGDKGYVSPYWLTSGCSQAMDKAGLFYLVRGNENQFYRLGFESNPAPLLPYLAASYPAISFHSGETPLPRDQLGQWSESFLAFFTDFLDAHASGFPTQWDRHYLFFQIKKLSLIVPERAYVIILLVILAMVFGYPMFFPTRFRSYALSVAKHAWAIPLLLALAYGLLVLGTLTVEGIMLARGFPTLWRDRPFPFFALKLSMAVFLFTLLYRYLRRIPFPRRGRFYNAIALLLLFVDIPLLGILDISLTYYVVWAIFWAFLFSLAKNRYLKMLFLLVSPAWFVKAVYDVFTLPALNVARELLLSRFTGNLIVAFLLLPFLLMLIRLDFMFRHPRRRTKKILVPVTYSVLGVACVLLVVYLFLYSPFGPDDPQPVQVSEVIDQSADQGYILVRSEAPLGTLSVRSGNVKFDISTRHRSFRYDLLASSALDRFSLAHSANSFLGRKSLQFTVDAQGHPSSIQASLSSAKEIVMYDSNFPFSYQDPNSVTIYIGRNPPIPLPIQLTVPEAQSGQLHVEVQYTQPPMPMVVTGRDVRVVRSLIANETVSIGGEPEKIQEGQQ